MLSYVQDQILSIILKKKIDLTYSELKPLNVDDDLYNYHLQQLVKKGYLSKYDGKYKLTYDGKSYVLQIDALGKYHEKAFRLSILCYVIRNHNEILLQKRLRQPYYGDIETIADKIIPGEHFEGAAKRKLYEETGIDIDLNKLIFIKKMRKKSFDEATGLTNNTIRSQYAYLYEGSVDDLQIEEGKSQGFVAWKIDELSHLSELDKNKFIPLILQQDMLDIFDEARKILLK